MDISDKEILINELDEHLRQVSECIVRNPFNVISKKFFIRAAVTHGGIHKKHEFVVPNVPLRQIDELE